MRSLKTSKALVKIRDTTRSCNMQPRHRPLLTPYGATLQCNANIPTFGDGLSATIQYHSTLPPLGDSALWCQPKALNCGIVRW